MEKNLEKESSGRRSFLKFFGLGTLATAVPVVTAKAVDKLEPEEDYLVKEWTEGKITYLEFLLPTSVPAVFSTENQEKTIHCPIHKLGRNYSVQPDKMPTESCQPDLKISEQIINGHNVIGHPIKEDRLIPSEIEHSQHEELITKQIVNYAEMMTNNGEWESAYIYKVRIKNHPELFGIFMNKARMEIDADNYTVYKNIEQPVFTDGSDYPFVSTRRKYVEPQVQENGFGGESVIDTDRLKTLLG